MRSGTVVAVTISVLTLLVWVFPISFHGISCGSALWPADINTVALSQEYGPDHPGEDSFHGYPARAIA